MFPSLKTALLSIVSLQLLAVSGQAQWLPSNMTDATNGSYQASLTTYELTNCGGVLFFAAGYNAFNSEPCISFGSYDKTYLLADISPSGGSEPEEFTRVGDVVFFSAADDVNGRELWKTDLTTLETTLVKNLRAGPYSSNPHSLAALNGRLIFSAEADPTTTGDELWITDGTAAGTVLLKDIAVGSGKSNISKPAVINGIAYFQASDIPDYGSQLWRSDGTAAGTFRLYNKPSNSSAYPRRFTAYNGSVYCMLKDGSSGNAYALWKTNGQVAGTAVVKSPVTGGGADGGSTSPDNIVVASNLMFFRGGSDPNGYELWRSDGTAAGTTMVKDIRTGSGSSYPTYLTVFNNQVYFFADDGVHGSQLWKSDGTATGTVMVHEVYNGSGSNQPSPHGLTAFGGHLFFKMTRDGYGLEWWASDGVTLGSTPAFELVEGSGSSVSKDSSPYGGEHVVCGNGLYFPGYHPVVRNELWRLGVPLTISAQPQSRLVATGSSVRFTVAPAGGANADCKWKKNGLVIPGATALNYDIPAATLSHAGAYQALLTSNDGNAASENAKLGVVATVLPAVQSPEGGTITLSVSASAPSGTALSYEWKRGSTLLANGIQASGAVVAGAKLNKLVITKATGSEEGAYTCTVRMDALELTTEAAAVTIVARPVVTAGSVPPAITSGFLTWQIAASEGPSSYTITGLPSGLGYNKTTGLISGTPNVSGSFKIKVTAKNVAGSSTTQEFTLNIAALPNGTTGAFSALVGRNQMLNGEFGGYLSFTTFLNGTITGKLKNGTSSLTVKGRLTAPVSDNPTAIISVPRPGRGTTPLTLNLTFNGPATSVTGTLTDGSATTTVTGRRYLWTRTGAAAYAGPYNMSMTLPGTSVGDAAHPQGNSFQQMTVTAAGAVSGSGRTPEGISYTFGGTLWPDGSLPQFVMLYANHGSITGLPRITLGAQPSADLVDGWVEHIKTGPANSADRTYKSGIPLLSRAVSGSRWLKPDAASPIVLGLPDAADNATITFSRANVEAAAQFGSLAQTFRINKNNTTTFAPVTAGNPCNVKMSIVPGTGLFTGTFSLVDTVAGKPVSRPGKFAGVLLNHRGKGLGHYTLPELLPSTSTSAILSGHIVVN